MANYQLPPLKNSEKFEHFVCELFNHIDKTDSYIEFQMFGIKGQNQKGIDIFSQKARTVIQCKLRDTRKKDDVIRKNLIEEIESDLEKTTNLNFQFERMIFASTFKDDAVIQEYLNQIKDERNYPFSIYYLGWDTLSNYAENYEELLKKHFPQFRQRKSKTELPDGALGKDLLKKNYVNRLIKHYGRCKQYQLDRTDEKFNYASFNKHLMNKYKAAGINHIPLSKFDDIVFYLQDKIDGTIFGKHQKKHGMRNYSTFEEYVEESS